MRLEWANLRERVARLKEQVPMCREDMLRNVLSFHWMHLQWRNLANESPNEEDEEALPWVISGRAAHAREQEQLWWRRRNEAIEAFTKMRGSEAELKEGLFCVERVCTPAQ